MSGNGGTSDTTRREMTFSYQVQVASQAGTAEDALANARDLAALLTEAGYDLVGIEVVDGDGNDVGGVA